MADDDILRTLREIIDALKPLREMDQLLKPIRETMRMADDLSSHVPKLPPEADWLRTVADVSRSTGVDLKAFVDLRDIVRDLGGLSAEAQEVARYWREEAPAALLAAVRSSGTFPHPELTMDDLQSIIRAYREQGQDRATEVLHELNRQIFEGERARAELKMRWEQSPRWAVLREILQAHDAALFAVSVPAAIAQAEGVVAELFAHVGSMPGRKLEEYIQSATAADDLLGPIARGFVAEVLLAKFGHGDGGFAYLSRHAILHGADCSYGTRGKSVAALVWLDFMLLLQHERRDER